MTKLDYISLKSWVVAGPVECDRACSSNNVLDTKSSGRE